MRLKSNDRSIPMAAAAVSGVCCIAYAMTLTAISRTRRQTRLRTPASSLMTTNATCITETQSAESAAERLAEAGVGALPVCDERGRLSGMLTDRDIVVRVIAQGLDPRRTAVARCVEREPVSLGTRDTAATAATAGAHTASDGCR